MKDHLMIFGIVAAILVVVVAYVLDRSRSASGPRSTDSSAGDGGNSAVWMNAGSGDGSHSHHGHHSGDGGGGHGGDGGGGGGDGGGGGGDGGGGH